MKFILLVLFSFTLSAYTQTTFVPDDSFEQALIDLGYDSGPLDNFVQTVNIENINFLSINGRGITDLTGIEDFIGLTLLNADDNNLNFVNLTSNIYLKNLAINRNGLSGIDISNNSLLETVTLDENELTNIDVSSNAMLTLLNVNFNQLESLNIENNPNIVSLSCFINNITSFSIPEDSALDFLQIGLNPLESLDIRNGRLLTYLSAPETGLIQIDLSQNTILSELILSSNTIENIDLNRNDLLYVLWIDDNPISQIDLSQNLELWELRFGSTKIEALDLSLNTELTRIDGKNNELLCSIDLRNNNNTLITTFFDLTNCPLLGCVYVDNVNYSQNNWINIDNTLNFIISEEDCISECCPSDFDYELSLENIIIDGNNIQINLVNSQDFLYGLDNTDSYQQESFFSNVSQGFHTIYVTDINRCLQKNLEIFIPENNNLYIPKFFTPNNDNKNDLWKITDPNQIIKVIYIFNRYGKLLKTLSPTSNGWNGIYNGKSLPCNSYWYKVDLKSGHSINGYFSLNL